MKAAYQGDMDAQYTYGMMCYTGEGVERDYGQAITI